MATTSGLNLFDPIPFAHNGVRTRTITASTTKGGAVFLAPKTGNIRFIGTTYTALSGSPALDLRLETVATKFPTGTLFGTNTNAAYSPASTNTFVWTQLTADAAVTAGNAFAAVVGYTSGTSATLVNGLNGLQGGMVLLPFNVTMASGSWAAAADIPTVCVKYDDGTIVRGCAPIGQHTSSSLQSGTNPNERACVFTAPVGATIIGVRFITQITATATLTANLYSGTSTTPESGGTITLPAGAGVESAPGIITLYFAAPISLVAGTQYRLSVKATTTQNVAIYRFLFASTAERNATFGESSSDTRNGASWIGEVTTTSEMIYPLFGTLTAEGSYVF